MTVKVPGAALLTAALVIGGQFRTKLGGGESVSLAIPRPAEAVLAAKTLELKLGPSQAPPNRLLQLTQFIQQDLSRQFEVTSNKPDATLQFSVIAYEPVKKTRAAASRSGSHPTQAAIGCPLPSALQ